ncbi:MAG: hypothetical protein ACK415_12995, partial [Thermodesulfovibrionales bacterium]
MKRDPICNIEVDDGFNVTASELKTYSTKTLIIATGMRRKLKVQGEGIIIASGEGFSQRLYSQWFS